jgi:uncharacterized protein
MLSKAFPGWGAFYSNASTALILGLVGVMSLYIIVKMVEGAKKEIAAKKAREAA